MNHLSAYIALCRRAELRETRATTEKHHVFPKFRFGDNGFTVDLTLREHFIAHLLLVKIMEKRYGSKGPYILGALRAVFIMSINGKGKTTSRLYEAFRKKYVDNLRGKAWGGSTEEKSLRMTKNNPMKILATRKRVAATIKNHWANGVYKPFTAERNERVRQSKLGVLNPMYGNKQAADHLNKSNSRCSKCGMVTTKGNWKRWHEEECHVQPKVSL